MISTDFAPNERFSDALISLSILFQPWKWKKGGAISKVKRRLKTFFPNTNSFLFLTGRASFYQLFKSLDLKKNSEVLVQGFTCEAVILPIIANKFKPVYVDIETKTYSMDQENLTKKINTNTKVLILQHTFGLTPIHRNQILQVAKKNNLIVIEDLAHGFDNELFKKDSYSTIKILSFGRSKFFSSLFGGAIISHNEYLNKKLQTVEKSMLYPTHLFIFKALLYKPISMLIKLTYDIYLGKIIHQIVKRLNILIPEITTKEKKGEYDLFLNKAYPNSLAILLLHQLDKFEKIKNTRIEASKIYQTLLPKKGLNSDILINNYSLLRYPILVEDRDAFIKQAKKKNIFLGTWYDQIVAPKSIDLDKFQYKVGECPQGEKICQKIINLPTLISVNQAKKVVNNI